jgi:hypothetical protein
VCRKAIKNVRHPASRSGCTCHRYSGLSTSSACLEIADKRLERHVHIADKRTHERLCDFVCAEERRVVRAIFTRGHSEDVPRRGSLDEYRAATNEQRAGDNREAGERTHRAWYNRSCTAAAHPTSNAPTRPSSPPLPLAVVVVIAIVFLPGVLVVLEQRRSYTRAFWSTNRRGRLEGVERKHGKCQVSLLRRARARIKNRPIVQHAHGFFVPVFSVSDRVYQARRVILAEEEGDVLGADSGSSSGRGM